MYNKFIEITIGTLIDDYIHGMYVCINALNKLKLPIIASLN